MTGVIMTIGPATATKEKLMKCDHYGVDILRFNFSHYNIENARKVVTLVREVEQELGKKFELLLDTTGPEIRTGKLETPLEFDEGDVFNIYINEADRDPKGFTKASAI